MFLEIILAGLVAYSAHNSAYNSANSAAASVIGEVEKSTDKLERHLSVVELKVDQLHLKIDTNQVRLMRALTWHDYIQTLHVKGAKYKGDNLYVFKEKRTTTTANLATKEVKEVNGRFTLFKNFNDDTEKLYAEDYLVYEKFPNGETKVYDDQGRVYMHTNLEHDTYTYLPNGKTHSIKWHDGAVWIYKYDKHGQPIEIESYNMQPTSRRPVQPTVELAINKWRKCIQAHSVGACVAKCMDNKSALSLYAFGSSAHSSWCLNDCKQIQQTACGTKPIGPLS